MMRVPPDAEAGAYGVHSVARSAFRRLIAPVGHLRMQLPQRMH